MKHRKLYINMYSHIYKRLLFFMDVYVLLKN